MGDEGGRVAERESEKRVGSMAAPNLEDVGSAALFAEMLRRFKCATKGEKRIILVGPPGCGKGTQSPFIKEEYCLCHLATGDMLRNAAIKGTPLGLEVKAAMESVLAHFLHHQLSPSKSHFYTCLNVLDIHLIYFIQKSLRPPIAK